jgi:ketosteroid isomerase-like protein
MGEARDLMARATAAIFAQDFEALRACYAPDVVVTGPDVGTMRGVDKLIDYMRGFADAMPDMDYRTTREIEAGSCAIDQGEVVGTNTGPLAMPDGSTLPATGRQVRMRSVDIATVEDGRIVQHDFYFDQLELMTQLGLIDVAATAQQ